MEYQTKLNEQLQIIVGKRLDNLHLVCELMSFAFEEYAFHALGLTRIIHENDILVTTIDYLKMFIQLGLIFHNSTSSNSSLLISCIIP